MKHVLTILIFCFVSVNTGNCKASYFNVKVTFYGGVEIRIENTDEKWMIESYFSTPKVGFNKLSISKIDKVEKKWNPCVKWLSIKKVRIFAKGQYYSIVRIINIKQNKIVIRDTFENNTNKVIGIIIKNVVTTYEKLISLTLAGVPVSLNYKYNDECSENPTLFLKTSKSSLGVVVIDNVYRLQLKLRALKNGGILETDQFGLAPGNSYTLVWEIYPLTQGDYYDFINILRREWKVDFKIDGPFDFMFVNYILKTPDNMLKEFLTRKKLRFIALNPWIDLKFGFDYKKSLKKYKDAIKKIKKVSPKTKVLLCIQPVIMNPVNKYKLNQYPYRDSLVIGLDDKPVLDSRFTSVAYIPKEKIKEGWALYWHYPMLTNSWGKKIEKDVEFALDEVGADGVYIDTFSYAQHRYWARYTYDKWDGHTVDIDPNNFTVIRKYADLSLLTLNFRKNLVTKIKRKGKIIIANTQPATFDEQELKFIRFWEFWRPENFYRVHLYTPIALDYQYGRLLPFEKTPKGFIKRVVQHIMYGVLPYYYYTEKASYAVMNRIFPITPIEIHKGYIIGKRKIITVISGYFGWGDNTHAKMYIYDKYGNEKIKKDIIIKNKNKIFINIDKKKKILVILERNL